MKEIKLTKGRVVLVSDKACRWLSEWKWYAHFSGRNWKIISRPRYKLGRRKPTITMSRTIMGLKRKDVTYVDHKNGNSFDNRRSNLRICTNSQNLMNRGAPKNNTSGFKGVSFDKKSKKWGAKIAKNYKQIALGFYEDKKDAAKAYNKAAKKLHGSFAYLNKI